MPESCSCCGKQSEPHLLVKCCVCQNVFNNSCAGISSSETRLINSKKSFSWTCSKCHRVGNDINALKAAVIALQEEMKLLKSNNSSNHTTGDGNFEEIVSEVLDRQTRKRNLLIFNASEQSRQLSNDERNIADKNNVLDIIEYLLPTADIANCNVFRLGKYNPSNNRPRPIKIRLRNEDDTRKILQKSGKLKNSDSFKDIFMTPDRTPRELEYYKKLKNELQHRKDNGEDDIIIKYINNIPKIIKTDNLN